MITYFAISAFFALVMVFFMILAVASDGEVPGCLGCLFILLPLLNTFIALPIVFIVWVINR